MHDALLISEVLGTIVECLEDRDIGIYCEYPGRQALAVLARTCRAFSKPALDALWRKLDSLKPFILCLPNNLKASQDDGPLLPFNEEEWNVVLRYSPRVHELMLEQDDLSIKILQSLWFRTTLLLPNLRKLYWDYQDQEVIASIRMLLSPSLVDLHVWLEDGGHTSTLAFLDHYHTFCPNLKSLYFGHSRRFPYVTSMISRAICRFSNVENLICNDIDEEALIHVTQSRSLRKFICSLLGHEPDALRGLVSHGTPGHPPFENLRVLDLRVEDLSPIILYLRSQNQPFEEVSFSIRTIPTHEVFHEFFVALSSATRRRTLRRIRVITLELEIAPDSVDFVDFQVLSPLMTFNLHKLEINIENPISLNDEAFFRMVQSWPELESLCFNDCSGWSYSSSVQLPTLKGLLLLLARCPELCDLGLCLDARIIPSLSEDESLICNRIIKKFSVSNSPIQEPVTKVVHFLLEHLLSLVAVGVYNGTSMTIQTDYHRAWRTVNREIKQIVGRRSPGWNDD